MSDLTLALLLVAAWVIGSMVFAAVLLLVIDERESGIGAAVVAGIAWPVAVPFLAVYGVLLVGTLLLEKAGRRVMAWAREKGR
jgi:hypothetical protein